MFDSFSGLSCLRSNARCSEGIEVVGQRATPPAGSWSLAKRSPAMRHHMTATLSGQVSLLSPSSRVSPSSSFSPYFPLVDERL